jgi:hypothetical protein
VVLELKKQLAFAGCGPLESFPATGCPLLLPRSQAKSFSAWRRSLGTDRLEWK